MEAVTRELQRDLHPGHPTLSGALTPSRSGGDPRADSSDGFDSFTRVHAGSSDTTAFVIPTLNESGNLGQLVARIGQVMGARPYRCVVVDDGSTDGTPEIAHALIAQGHPVDLLERGEKRGIGSAVRDGLLWALAQPSVARIVTLDADLSHDPRDIPGLLRAAETFDLVQGSRYTRGGRVLNWGWPRRLLSLIANALVRVYLDTEMREHTTYLRAYSREAAQAAVRAKECEGYAWALESLLAVRQERLSVCEVPITFRERTAGKSKMSPSAAVRWVRYVSSAALAKRGMGGALSRLTKFALVGSLGILVNLGLLYLLVGVAGLWPLVALLVAIEASITSNFILNDFWTFRKRKSETSRLRRFAVYHVVCGAGFGVSVMVFVVMTVGFGANYLVSNLIAILAGFAANFRGSASWTWLAR